MSALPPIEVYFEAIDGQECLWRKRIATENAQAAETRLRSPSRDQRVGTDSHLTYTVLGMPNTNHQAAAGRRPIHRCRPTGVIRDPDDPAAEFEASTWCGSKRVPSATPREKWTQEEFRWLKAL
jgi:hypothetical protein